jgi:uncharacterized protein YndB with AHSA1/START domain
MAIVVDIETDVARPPEPVFAALTDVEAWPAWLIATGIIRVARDGEGPLAVGTRLWIDQRAAGRASAVDAAVTELVPDTRFAVRGTDGDGVTTTLEATLAPTPTGTHLHWSARVDLPFRYRIFESMAAPQVRRAAALDIEALKRRLESAPPG